MSKISQINQTHLETKALNFIRAFNNHNHFSKSDAIYCYGEILRERIKNPVGAEIALRDMLEKEPIDDMFRFSNNITYIEQEEGIQKLLNQYEESDAKYPNLLDVRTKLIEEKRVNHGQVTPILKGFDKFILKLKLFFS